MFLWVQDRVVDVFKSENSRMVRWMVSSQTLTGRQRGTPKIKSFSTPGLCDVMLQIAKYSSLSAYKYDGKFLVGIRYRPSENPLGCVGSYVSAKRAGGGGMGFRDLECFNQEMLAKQGWRIVQQPESLLARFLRSRYYPHGEFLSAGLGTRPSFAWRRLLFGRELLLKGLRLEVGNGETTKVWIDRWVDDPIEGLIAPWIRNTSFDANLMAASLIDRDTRRWNTQALQEIFVLGDIELILRRQPVINRGDFYSWKFNRSGNFTVKSAYWLACDVKTKKKQPEAHMLPSVNPLKEEVWKVLTVPKIKIFLWKTLNDALPVALSILKRGMKVDDRCQLYGDVEEDINHVLFTCHIARQVWAVAEIPSPRLGFNETSVFENLNFLLGVKKLRSGSADKRRAWPWVVLNLWKSRNKFLFEGRKWLAEEIVEKAKKEADEWFLAQVVEKEIHQKQPKDLKLVKQRWKPPPEEWLMCNIAYDWDKRSKSLGVAWVVRNHRGVVICHSRRAFAEIASKDQAKLQTIWAAESMNSLHFNKLIFAGVFEVLFGAVLRPQAWPSFLFQREEFIRSLVVWKSSG